MHPQDVAARPIEPGDDDDLVPRSDALETLEHRSLEDEPRVRCPLVALFRGRCRIGQRRFDPSDRRHVKRLPADVLRLDPDCHPVIAGLGSAVRVSPVRKSATTGANTLIFTLWLTPASSRSSAFGSTHASAREPARSTAGLLAP